MGRKKQKKKVGKWQKGKKARREEEFNEEISFNKKLEEKRRQRWRKDKMRRITKDAKTARNGPLINPSGEDSL